MRVAIMGSGGVGGYFGARLALAGEDVTFIARGAHLAAIRQNGLRIESALGDLHVAHPRAVDDGALPGPVDLVLFSVKLWDTESAARAIAPLVGPDTAVISFQNGVQKDEVLRRVVGERALMGGVSYISATIAEPGVIRHAGTLQKLVFGEYDGQRSARAESFLAACQRAGIEAEISPSIRRAIWEKFVFLVGLSSLTASTRTSIGPVRSHPATRALLLEAMREVVAVGSAQGVDLAPDFAENRLAFCDTLPPDMTSSMARDLERGNRLELEWLAGDVVKRGAETNLAVPVNRVITGLLSPYADGGQKAAK